MLDVVADFETTTDPNDCRVWGWGLAYISLPDAVEIGHELDEFLDRISFEDTRCYFHNLKFDGHFILDYILKHGYIHIEKDDKMIPGTFKTLISDKGMFYSIEVMWSNGHKTQFRDSLKKLTMSVAAMADAFKLPISKGDIDYHKPRPVGYRMTPEERKYVERDVSIVAHALATQLNEGMTRLTVGSDALAEFKRLSGKMYDKLFPVLDDEMDAEIRRAYRGGFTYADDRFKKRHLQCEGVVLDVNSLYPFIMYTHLIPYGKPEFVEGFPKPTKQRPLTVFTVTFTAKLKPEHIPCIQVKSSFMFSPTEYVREIPDPVTLAVTNVDWELYNEHYDIQVIEYGGGWRFKADTGFFNTYIDKWSEIKANSTGGLRTLAKLYLNSLYGKFATNPNVTAKIPTLHENRVKLELGPYDTRDPVYTAAGVFITAHARAYTIRAAQANYDTFAYADTDSLHLLRPDVPDTIEVHPNKLGAWKREYGFTEAFYIRAKGYLERRDDSGEIETHIAGVPDHVARKLEFDDIRDGHVLKGKLIPKPVPGGVVLVDIDYKLVV